MKLFTFLLLAVMATPVLAHNNCNHNYNYNDKSYYPRNYNRDLRPRDYTRRYPKYRRQPPVYDTRGWRNDWRGYWYDPHY